MTHVSEAADGGKSNAIVKVCMLLKALGDHAPQRLNELAAATGLNRGTTFRILEELATEGLVTKSGTPPRYDFGPEFVALAAASVRSRNLVEIARPGLLRLAELSGDTVLLHVRSNAESLCADKMVGSFPIRANMLHVGSRRPLGIGAGSMALLAWLPDAERDAILAISCTKLRTYPNFSEARFRDYIAAARRHGHVIMCDVIIDKMGAIAAPIRNASGAVVAAISIAALSERLFQREKLLASALKTECSAIQKLMNK